MKTIEQSIIINAPPRICFDLVRSIEAHALAVPNFCTLISGGRASGLSSTGDTTRWSARVHGLRFRMWMRVTACEPPRSYREHNTSGPFRHFSHDYTVVEEPDGRTRVSDTLCFQSPFGLLGSLVDQFLILPLLRRALATRLASIKRWAENGEWKQFLPPQTAGGA